jgi:glycosyltransferase involved in cell wall biosynthesis
MDASDRPCFPIPALMKFLHLNYHCHLEQIDPLWVIEKHKFASGFIDPLSRQVDFLSVKHMDFEGRVSWAGITYHFFRRKNQFFNIPSKTHNFIKKQKPDVILVEGFVFPFQVLLLRRVVGPGCRIIVQHHAEIPFSGIRGRVQKWADRCIDAYLFTSIGNAKPWLKTIIRNPEKCVEVLSASTSFKPLDKHDCRRKLGITGPLNFLWVGLLHPRKDPLTVLTAFSRFLNFHPQARLYMIYQSEELLGEIKNMIRIDDALGQAVILLGKKTPEELPAWYSAMDIFILGSHREGSGYALVEAMTCGCFPVVTDIPSFHKITDHGRLGLLFEPGKPESLLQKLQELSLIHLEEKSREIKAHTALNLSFETIAHQFMDLCRRLNAQ